MEVIDMNDELEKMHCVSLSDDVLKELNKRKRVGTSYDDILRELFGLPESNRHKKKSSGNNLKKWREEKSNDTSSGT